MNSSPLSDKIDRCLHIPNFNINSLYIALITVQAVFSNQYLYACLIVLGTFSGTSGKHKSSTLVASVP